MGALIISPTRELAYQTFEVLKKIGRFHDFSAGLVIGGKVSQCRHLLINIQIAEPYELKYLLLLDSFSLVSIFFND